MGSILGGDIESAMADLKSSECKDVFKDAELVFSMYKQNVRAIHCQALSSL